jgi:geranylgeranyl diphosphate synthase type I
MTITDIGQIDDMQQTVFRLPVAEKALLRRYEQKSSYYSFVNPLEMALILAGKDARQARRDAEAFGLPTGIAFQLRDDYLGIFGETLATGKPNLDDVREGKYTFMVHYALQKASEEEKRQLLAILGSPAADETTLATVRHILTKTGSVERTMADARRYADEARRAAGSAASWDEEFGGLLVELVDFIVEREQ